MYGEKINHNWKIWTVEEFSFSQLWDSYFIFSEICIKEITVLLISLSRKIMPFKFWYWYQGFFRVGFSKILSGVPTENLKGFDPSRFGTCCFVFEALGENTDPTVFLSVHEGINYIKNMLLKNGVENAISFSYFKLNSWKIKLE